MAKFTFGQIAKEVRLTYNGDKTDMPIVGLEHIVPKELTVTNYDINTNNTFTKSFKKGQILFGRRRAYQHKAAIATFNGICSGDITVIEPIEGMVYPALLPFIVQNDAFFSHAVQGSAGSLSPRVKWEHLSSYEIELPSIEEQRVLAEKLWAAYRLKESYKRLLAATDEMIKSQFIEMFGDSIHTKKLIEVCNIEKGSTITKEQTSNGDIPVVAGGLEPSCYHNVANRPAGMITVSASGANAGYVNYWEVPIFASDCNTIYPIELEKVSPIFMYWQLKVIQKQIYKLQKGGAQPHVYGKDLADMQIVQPPMEFQLRYVKIAEQANKSKFELRKSIDAIDQVIKSLING